MPAFNLEHEQRRLSEPGITHSAKLRSVKDSLRTLVAERTETPSFFELKVESDLVTGTGYEHRGDLEKSFANSETEAPSEKIAKRYSLENRGYKETKKYFTSLPLYSTVMLFSPPPDQPIPGYPGHSFAYFYHITPGENEGERTIKAISWVNRFSKEDQADILSQFKKDGDKVLPEEESILTSPVSIEGNGNGTESFRTFWSIIKTYFEEKSYTDFFCPPDFVMERYMLDGEKIIKTNYSELDTMISDLAGRLANGATQYEIADDFNTMLKTGDRDLLFKDWGRQDSIHMNIPTHENQIDPRVIFQKRRNYEPVRQVMTFCGISDAMNTDPFGKTSSGEAQVNKWSFTVKNDALRSNEKTILCCTCPFCEKQVEAEIGGGKITCPKCGKSASWKND